MYKDGVRDRDSLAVLADDGTDTARLTEWFASFPEYDVCTVDPGESLPETFDCCLVDRTALTRCEQTLRACKSDGTVDRPYLLLVEGESPAHGGSARTLAAPSEKLIDSVLVLPANPEAIREEVDDHLRLRRTRKRLLERDSQYAALLSPLPEAVLVVRDGEVLVANERAASTFGRPDADTFEGESLYTGLQADAAAQLRSYLADAGGGSFRTMDLQRTDGASVTVEVGGTVVPYGGGQAVQLIVRDLTRYDERSRQASLFRRAVEASPNGVTVADATRRGNPLVYVNPAFESMTGYDAGAVLGSGIGELYGDHTDHDTVSRIERAVTAAEPASVEVLVYRPDGTPFWDRMDVIPIRTGPDVTHVLVLHQDITEEIVTEQRLTVLDRALRHNVGNRATVIRGQAEHLLETGGQETREAAEAIVEATADLTRISDQVRQFRGLITERSEAAETLDLARVLADAVADTPQVTLGVPESAPVLAHSALSLAVTELLAFASRPAGADLSVTVSTSEDEHTLIVTDDGGTIPEIDFEAMDGRLETPLEHPYGLEPWLVRWATEYSGGSVRADADADPPVIELTLPAAE